MIEFEFGQKVHLSLEIELIEVENYPQNHCLKWILRQFPYINLYRETRVFNFDDLYLQAQIDFLTKLKFCHQLLTMICPELDFWHNWSNPVSFGTKTKDHPPPSG